MNNLSNKIIAIFLHRETLILKDSEIRSSLGTQGIECHIDEVRQHVQALSPALFQISLHKDNTVTIRVEPTIDICGAFLAGRCHKSIKSCNKLHLCREFGHCTIQNCRYPHDFTHGENRNIIQQMNCQDIDCQLLVRLIRLMKCREKTLPRSTTFPNSQNLTHYAQQIFTEIDIDKQVDISFPSSNLAPQLDMEIIDMTLAVENLRIQKKLSESENECFRRVTVQFERKNDVEKLLSSLIPFNIDDVKFKRTKQIVDRTSFILKVVVNNHQDRILDGRVKLYVDLLVDKPISSTMYDVSTTNGQLFLIQCNTDIEFDKICQKHQLKPQLQGKDIALVQIYECDTVCIRYLDDNNRMNIDAIENIIRSARTNIFTYQLVADNCGEVEFINTDAYKKWMSNIKGIMAKFNITVTPIINYIDDIVENENVMSSVTSVPFHVDTPFTDQSRSTVIKLRSEWAMVASHPVFKVEYTDYIRNELGGKIEINGDEVSYTGGFPRLPRSPTNESILVNKTNNYMQKLKYHTFHDLKRHHVAILRDNSLTVAYHALQGNDYMVATKAHEMFELKNKLFPKTNQRYQPNPVYRQSSDSYRSPTISPPKLEMIESSTSVFPITTSEQINIFSINSFEDRLRQHLKETFNATANIERTLINNKVNGEKSRIIIRLTGEINDTESALDYLVNLFSLLRIRKFHDKTDGNWTNIEEAVQVIQHHFVLKDLLCICQRLSPTSIGVNYFDLTSPQFGLDEETIEDIINNLFSSATIAFNQQSTTSKFTKEWADLEDIIRKRADYKKDICLSNESNTIYLFGLTELVREFRQQFEQLKNEHVPQPCKIDLSEKQLNYLKHVAKDDLNKLEKLYEPNRCDISLTILHQHGYFHAPPHLHSKIKDNLEALIQLNDDTFEIKSSSFAVIIASKPECLLSLVKSKCYLEHKVRTKRVHISVPRAQAADLEDIEQQSKNPTVTAITSLNVGNSTITITKGDLTTQVVDIIVVCSTSDVMRKSIIMAAGPQVQAEYDALNAHHKRTSITSSGTLPCKAILFLPWKSNPTDPSSLGTFVSTAIKYAIDGGYKTIAFPSVGCGKLGFDPSLIAQHMIDETQIQLTRNHTKLDVSFVLLSEQQNVYDEFVKYLGTLNTSSLRNQNSQLVIPYQEKIVQITLTSSNKYHLLKCKQDILELSRLSSFTKTLTNKDDMIDWPQATINEYYTYCLKQHVIPKLDFDKRTVELIGPKDAVDEADKYFYELTTEIFKQARNYAVARGVIWSVEVSPGSNTWEQYSFKLNGILEDARHKKMSQLDFLNNKQEKCRIVFASMVEQQGSGVRAIRRKEMDSLLPDTWESSDQNCKRVTLQRSSEEYRTVLKQFNATMYGQYAQIVKIERIQNERWYKQYAAHREDFERRSNNLDERLLFHGCLDTSADKIIRECFNRAFAGANGVTYGCGVYFHSHASYSHKYAKASATEERTMFLARVLIGKTCHGDSSMKVPPSGCDTTTDGQNIFVVYHDAGAYAEHLITYK